MSGAGYPVISVLLPVRNAAACVADAIRSILSQSFAQFELLVVENGSTDGTRDVLQDCVRRDARIRVRYLPEPDLVRALNYGLSMARGSLIARMDADDLSHPERFALQLRHLEHRNETGLVSCLVRHTGHPTAQEGYASYVDWVNSLRTHEQISLHRFVESPLVHPSVLFRRELAERFGAWRRGQFPEDYELWLRWLEAGVRMEKLEEVLLDWSDPADRLSRTDARYSRRAFFHCKAAYLQRWLETAPIGNRSLLFWGAGRETRRRLRKLQELGVRAAGWIDVDSRKWGNHIAGLPVYSPSQLPTHEECFVVSAVSNRGARDEIAQDLDSRGFVAGQDYVLAG
jgi:glycosyltransferase involved in cell wall biosynthesis